MNVICCKPIRENTVFNLSSKSLKGKDCICTQYFTTEELREILHLSIILKQDRFNPKWRKILQGRAFLMLFYNPSIRTRSSFETAAFELGGHAQYMTPEMGRFKSNGSPGETIEDIAKVISRYMVGMGIRIEDKGAYYKAGHEVLLEYAKWATIPVINMADDRFHPCQALADLLGWAEWFGGGACLPVFDNLKGKNLLITWSKGVLHRSRTSPQETMLLASRFGMNITVARPNGYDLDNEVYNWTKRNCEQSNSTFKIVEDPDSGYEDAHVVYSRNWISEKAYEGGFLQKKREIENALKFKHWMTTQEKMKKTNNAIFTHPMPVDRGNEVEDTVASGSRSAIYDIAENRLYVQKAIMVLTMGEAI